MVKTYEQLIREWQEATASMTVEDYAVSLAHGLTGQPFSMIYGIA